MTPHPPFRFHLRREVRLDGAELHDSLSGSICHLSGLARAIVPMIERPITADALMRQLGPSPPRDRSRVERELRRLLLCGLLEGACDSTRSRLEWIRAGEPLPLHALEGSRFGCQNSGACCRGYVFGPISAQEKARIEALEPRRALPLLGDGPMFVEAEAGAAPTYRLATHGDTCVFYEGATGCGLHRAFGPAAKPALCQLYPLAALATVDGLKIYDRGECATFAVSARSGTLLSDAAPDLRALVRDDLYHPFVWLHRTWQCDYGLILELARRLDREVQSNLPLDALHGIGHLVRGLIIALTRCPLEAGQPEATVAGVLAQPVPDFRPPRATLDANARAGLATLATLAGGLAERVAPGEWLTPFFVPAAAMLREMCLHLVDGQPLSARAGGAAGVGIPADSYQAITLSLRQQTFGRDLLLDEQLPAGLLRMALVVLLTLTGARLRAFDERWPVVQPSHLSAAHMTARRTLHRPEPHALLRANGEQAWPVLDALPLLGAR